MTGDEAHVQHDLRLRWHDVVLGFAAHRRAQNGGGDAGLAQELVLAMRSDLRRFQLPHCYQELGHGIGRVDAGERHRAVGHLACSCDPHPHNALLTDAEVVLLRLADDGRVHVVGPALLHKMFDADHVALFVADRADEDVAAQFVAAFDDGLGCT